MRKGATGAIMWVEVRWWALSFLLDAWNVLTLHPRECMGIFDRANKKRLKEKLDLVLLSDEVWKKWWNDFKLYKISGLSCLPKMDTQDDFVQNKSRHTVHFFNIHVVTF
jgi:hypothetical protein